MGKHKTLDELKDEYIGKQFNWLTIIDVIKDNKYTWFKCQCICGNIKLINKYEVLRNKTISCGCNHKSEYRIQQLFNNIEKLKDTYINKTFGYLTVIDIYRNSKSAIIFKCKCICGNIVERNKFDIINNRIVSCGCYKHSSAHKEKLSSSISISHDRLDLDKLKVKYINKVFNQLTVLDVIRIHDKHNKEKIMFKCKCTCGCTKNILKDRVLNNKTKSCGCFASSNEVINNMSNSLMQLNSIKRANINWQPLLDVLHPDYFNDLLNGKLKTDSVIETKCPICNNYEKHALGNVYILSRSKFVYNDRPPLCNKCRDMLVTSQYEKEIAEYISTFYNNSAVMNSRNIISPQELDLYYPEKKIAIEFNGDYWHSSEFKENDYHYNKFIKCRENNILLVSIFESEWNNRKEEIKEYLKDLFNDVENKLSFNYDKTLMNNNYPSPNVICLKQDFIENYYIFKNNKVYTCGYSYVNN